VKKAHLRRYAWPTRCNVLQRTPPRSSIFACLASGTFLTGPHPFMFEK
jgi:hypothetical protein